MCNQIKVICFMFYALVCNNQQKMHLCVFSLHPYLGNHHNVQFVVFLFFSICTSNIMDTHHHSPWTISLLFYVTRSSFINLSLGEFMRTGETEINIRYQNFVISSSLSDARSDYHWRVSVPSEMWIHRDCKPTASPTCLLSGSKVQTDEESKKQPIWALLCFAV